MDPIRFSELKSSGEVELVGADSKSWLGVPLTTSRETIGVMAVQDYDMEGRYSEHEKEFLVSIAGQIAQLVERKRAEENLHALFLRHEALLAAIPEIVMEVNNDKVYTWANQAGREFFGEQVIGREAAFYFEGEQTVYQEVQPLFNGNDSTIYLESWQRRKDGQKRLLAWWCQVLKDEAGNVTGALSSARDITEQKLVEEQIKKQMAELQRWYDLTLDRENRSLELKHEVNELLSRLNEPPRYASAEIET
jgi:PAS domain S-box-containing protein